MNSKGRSRTTSTRKFIFFCCCEIGYVFFYQSKRLWRAEWSKIGVKARTRKSSFTKENNSETVPSAGLGFVRFFAIGSGCSAERQLAASEIWEGPGPHQAELPSSQPHQPTDYAACSGGSLLSTSSLSPALTFHRGGLVASVFS